MTKLTDRENARPATRGLLGSASQQTRWPRAGARWPAVSTGVLAVFDNPFPYNRGGLQNIAFLAFHTLPGVT